MSKIIYRLTVQLNIFFESAISGFCKILSFSSRMGLLLLLSISSPLFSQPCLKDTTPPKLDLFQNLEWIMNPSQPYLTTADLIKSLDDDCDSSPRSHFIKPITSKFYPIHYANIGKKEYVQIYAFDKTGNRAVSNTLLHVISPDCANDKIPPIVNCKKYAQFVIDISVKILAKDLVLPEYWENCGGVNFSFDSLQISDTLIRDQTFINKDELIKVFCRDEAGNISSCLINVAYINVVDPCALDSVAPVIKCKKEITVEMGENSYKEIKINEVLLETSDNCSKIFTSFSPNGMNDKVVVGNFNTNRIFNLYCSDISGNQSYCTFKTNIQSSIPDCNNDHSAPFLQCKESMDIYLLGKNDSLRPGDFINLLSDNCDSNPVLSFAENNILSSIDIPKNKAGTTEQLIVYANDQSNNQSQCITHVRYIPLFHCLGDSISPTLKCGPNPIVYFSDYDEKVFMSNFLDVAYDHCSAVNLSFDLEGKVKFLSNYSDLYGVHSSFGEISIYGKDDAGNLTVANCKYQRIQMPFTINLIIPVKLFSTLNDEDFERVKIIMTTEAGNQTITKIKKYPNPYIDFYIQSNEKIKNLLIDYPKDSIGNIYTSGSDRIETQSIILGTSSFNQPYNFAFADSDCNGEINIIDIVQQYEFARGNLLNDSCVGQFKGLFIDKFGNVFGNPIQFNHSQPDTLAMVLGTIGELYMEKVGHTAKKLNPIRVFDGDKLFLSTKNINCQSGQHYNIEFVMSDSMLYSGLQLNIPYDSSLLILDTIYSNFNLRSRDYHKSIGDTKIAWVNIYNPKIGNIAPSLSLGFTAKTDFKLSDAIRDDYQSISNFAMDNNFKVRPIKIDFSDINQNHEHASNANYILCFPNPTTENVSLVGKLDGTLNCTLDIYDAGGLLTNRQLINLSDGRIQHEIRFEHNGLYLVKITGNNGTTLTHKILVNK
jgi:hypothetical protein